MLPSRNSPCTFARDFMHDSRIEILAHVCTDGIGRESDRGYRVCVLCDQLTFPFVPCGEKLCRGCGPNESWMSHARKANTGNVTGCCIDALNRILVSNCICNAGQTIEIPDCLGCFTVEFPGLLRWLEGYKRNASEGGYRKDHHRFQARRFPGTN